MATSWQIDNTDEFVLIRIVGNYDGMDRFAAGLEAIAAHCRTAQRWRVMIDLTDMSDPVPPRDRFLLGKQAARVWGRRIKVALLAKPADITHFFENVATNDGANVRAFADREEARAWLKARALA